MIRHQGTRTRRLQCGRSALRVVLASCLMLTVPRVALACPVCFGSSDAPMAVATNTGIIFMLGVVVVMLGAFASFFVYLIRRANRIADEAAPVDAAGLAPSQGTAR
jgi:Na+-transporting NADH:ubiquinone oxidoreductase subunit NqrD